MFKRLSKWLHKATTEKWLKQVYNPIFNTYELVEHEIFVLTDTLKFLEDLQKQLYTTENKDEQQLVKERWEAGKLNAVLEHYRLAIEKLKEALNNMPNRPEKDTQYTISYDNSDLND